MKKISKIHYTDKRSKEKYLYVTQIQVDLRHKDETKDLPVVEIGIDLTEFYQSVEWDILSVPAQR